ncbi:hypothetical protein [Nocardiopsis oceani]
MTTTQLLLTALTAFMAAGLTALVLCAFMARSWRIRHGKPSLPWWNTEPELSGFGGPFSAVRWQALRLVRKGRTAEDPKVAYVARLQARQRIRQWENPWWNAMILMALVLQIPNLANIATGSESTAHTFFWGLSLVFFVVLLVLAPFQFIRGLRNARQAWDLNENRAAAYETELEREKAHARAAHREGPAPQSQEADALHTRPGEPS